MTHCSIIDRRGEGGGGGVEGDTRITRAFHDRAPFFQAPLIFRLNYLRCYGIISDRPLGGYHSERYRSTRYRNIRRDEIYTMSIRSGSWHTPAFEFLTLGSLKGVKKRLARERVRKIIIIIDFIYIFFFTCLFIFLLFFLFYSNFGKGCWRV